MTHAESFSLPPGVHRLIWISVSLFGLTHFFNNLNTYILYISNTLIRFHIIHPSVILGYHTADSRPIVRLRIIQTTLNRYPATVRTFNRYFTTVPLALKDTRL